MPAMRDTEYRGFVTAGTRTPTWAVAHRDVRPHVVQEGFVLDGDGLPATTGSKSVTDPMRVARIHSRRPSAISGRRSTSRLNAGEGMLLVRITAEKVVSENNIPGEPEQARIMSTGRR
jgi:hypothetical protein